MHSKHFSKLLDYTFVDFLKGEFKTSDFQFAHEEYISTMLYSFFVMETIHYFNSKGSNVLAVFLDFSKDFDQSRVCKFVQGPV